MGMYLNAFPENSGLGRSFEGSICSTSEFSQFLNFKCVHLGILEGRWVDNYIQRDITYIPFNETFRQSRVAKIICNASK